VISRVEFQEQARFKAAVWRFARRILRGRAAPGA